MTMGRSVVQASVTLPSGKLTTRRTLHQLLPHTQPPKLSGHVLPNCLSLEASAAGFQKWDGYPEVKWET